MFKDAFTKLDRRRRRRRRTHKEQVYRVSLSIEAAFDCNDHNDGGKKRKKKKKKKK